MKRIISMALVCVLLVGVVFALASCGAISGTYSAEGFGQKVTYKFSGSKVAVTTEMGDEKFTLNCTYELNDDETKITITPKADDLKDYLVEMGIFDDADDITDEELQEFLDEMAAPQSFEKGDDYIKISGMKYTKE